MKTEKLYDKDSHASEFEATVLSCEKADEGYKIILDKTLFFPEEGGQPSDTGILGGAEIYKVLEKDGIIYHFSKVSFNEGEKVLGKIDFFRRFSFMQNHSGEHIVSGIVNRKYGFDNVGFHLNEQFVTLDFNGMLTRAQLDEIEREANEAIYKNMPVKAYYPSKEELKNINYRSKKEIDGDIRIVQIGDVDICACCAPHVNFTGEIGMIKLLDLSKMRGGVRIILKCGRYALADYEKKYENIFSISNLLSAKQEETAKAVENLISKSDDIKQKLSELNRKLISGIIESSSPEIRFFYQKDFDMKELQILADGLHKAHGKTEAVFSGEGEKLNFVICGDEAETEQLFKDFKEKFCVRGGGRNGMMQGTVEADTENLQRYFEEQK